MPVFVEMVAVELAVTVSVGAVLAFVSGLLSPPKQSEPQHRPQGCRHCGSATAVEAGLDQDRAGRRQQ
jgi:hypothetical protein